MFIYLGDVNVKGYIEGIKNKNESNIQRFMERIELEVGVLTNNVNKIFKLKFNPSDFVQDTMVALIDLLDSKIIYCSKISNQKYQDLIESFILSKIVDEIRHFRPSISEETIFQYMKLHMFLDNEKLDPLSLNSKLIDKKVGIKISDEAYNAYLNLIQSFDCMEEYALI